MNPTFAGFSLRSSQLSYKQRFKASRTVGLPLLLVEDAVIDLLQAEGAHKVLGVKFAAERRDGASRDGLTACAAQSALPAVEVEGAERSSVQLQEAAIGKRLPTVLGLKKKRKKEW